MNDLPLAIPQDPETTRLRDDLLSRYPVLFSNLKDLVKLDDTFGVCGIVTYALSATKIPDASHLKSSLINTNFVDHKKAFDLYQIEKNIQQTPASGFIAKYGIKLQPYKVTRVLELNDLYKVLQTNQCINIAVACNYQRYCGKYTHWLALLKLNPKTAIVAGDLSPFGIRNEFIMEVDTNGLVDLCKEALTTDASTINSHQLSQDPQTSIWRSGNRFTNNVAVVTFPVQLNTKKTSERFRCTPHIDFSLSNG